MQNLLDFLKVQTMSYIKRSDYNERISDELSAYKAGSMLGSDRKLLISKVLFF